MNDGWKCPGCGACYAPWVPSCLGCCGKAVARETAWPQLQEPKCAGCGAALRQGQSHVCMGYVSG
jgi:hypothetical protein